MAEKRQYREFFRRPRILDYIGSGGMDEHEARQAAEGLIRRARAESGRYIEGPAPEPEIVRERREALRHGQEPSSS